MQFCIEGGSRVHSCIQDVDHDPSGAARNKVQQTLTFYELDLGLNHVVRKYAEPLAEFGNMLISGAFICFDTNVLRELMQISVPGGQDGPSGVIVCCENYLVYKNLGDQPDIRCPIPRRRVLCLFLCNNPRF